MSNSFLKQENEKLVKDNGILRIQNDGYKKLQKAIGKDKLEALIKESEKSNIFSKREATKNNAELSM